MLKLQNISKSFDDVNAVRDLSLEINEGEIFVLLGPTGAGKTTTLKITAGLIHPDAGNIFIDNNDVSEVPPAFRDISFVFESYNLFPIYNVYDNIAFALRSRLLQIGSEEIDKRVQSFSRDLHIESLLDRPTSTLSGGETQRVALARALVREARLNLFDEPLSNLDLKLREELRVEFKELHKKYQSTIFYVTHDHDSAVSIADRIGILFEGKLHQVGAPNDLIENPESVIVASLINYPAINVLNCTLVGKKLNINGKTTLVELSEAEVKSIGKITKADEFQIGLKPRNIFIGKKKNMINISGKVLHTEYQGYNKVINLDFIGLTIRLVTNQAVRLKDRSTIDVHFVRKRIAIKRDRNYE